jgi:hypothetical protein
MSNVVNNPPQNSTENVDNFNQDVRLGAIQETSERASGKARGIERIPPPEQTIPSRLNLAPTKWRVNGIGGPERRCGGPSADLRRPHNCLSQQN